MRFIRTNVLVRVLLLAAALGATAMAQVHPIGGGLPRPGGGPVRLPVPVVKPSVASPTPSPSALLPSLHGRFVGAVPSGSRVPLSMLPMLPMRSDARTIHPGHGVRRPMDAQGETITVANGAGCNNTVGALFNIGCSITWRSSGMTPTTDTYQDYYIDPTNGVETIASATASGATYKAAAGANHTLALSNAGTYILGVYDVTAGSWSTVVYVNAGPTFSIKVYQDPYHSVETYQYDVSSSGAAYIDVKNVTASDRYVVYVESTSNNPSCQFVSPAQSPAAAAGALCSPSNSPGQQAPGGELSVTWPLSSSISAGTYSVIVYDLTQDQRLGQVQVAITGSSGKILLVYPDGTGAGINPSPAPIPVATPSTTIAWDGNGEESATGINANISGVSLAQLRYGPSTTRMGAPSVPLPRHSVRTALIRSRSTAWASSVRATIRRAFTRRRSYDKTTQAVVASQQFRIVGYNAATAFRVGTTDQSSLTVAQNGNAAASLKFTNTSDIYYGVGNGDSFSGLGFTTGTDFTATAGNGVGVMAALSGKTIAQCTPVLQHRSPPIRPATAGT